LFKEIRLNTKVVKMATAGKQIKVTQAGNEQRDELYDGVLVSVGRAPNYIDLGLENTGVTKDDRGFIKCNAQQRTDDPHIYAVGDVNGGTLLAHRATREGRIAVEAILGEPSAFVDIVIPAVVYTDPEVAWCGLTETEAKQKNIEVKVAKFLWGASGRALTLDRTDGLTKLIIEPETERVLGVGITGVGAAELISEGVLAVEMGATARDIADAVHPHPTLSESLMEAAESFYGTATHTLSKPGGS
jgi:dihydrolipoamide dehydrogenase